MEASPKLKQKLSAFDYFRNSLWLKLIIVPVGLAGGLYCLLISIWIVIFPSKGLKGNYLFSRLIHYTARLWGYPQVVVNGHKEWIHPSRACIFVGNHRSNWDLITFSKIYPSRTFVLGKKELKKVPLFGFFFAGAGNYLIDRQNKEAAKQCMKDMHDRVVEQKHCVFIFPEGTRNSSADTLFKPFKLGAFRISKDTGALVIPLVSKGKVKSGFPGKIHLEILDPIDPANFDSAEELLEATQSAMEKAILL